MKVSCSLAILIALLLTVSSAHAINQTFFWSGDGSTQGGSGTWDTSTPHWGTAGTGPFNHAWTNATMGSDIAQFSGSPGTVDVVSAGINARRINVTVSGYLLQGGTITSDVVNNSFLIDKSAANAVTINNSFNVVSNGSYNVRIRNSGTVTIPLTLGGDYKLGTAGDGGTRFLDLDGTGASGSRIDFTGGLLDTSGASVRLRIGHNGGGGANNASVYNLSGNSTYAGGTHLVRGTVNVSNPNALGSGGVQLATSVTQAGDTVRVFLVGGISLASGVSFTTAAASGGGAVTAIIGKPTGDATTSTINGNINLNVDTTTVEFHVAEAGAQLNLAGLITDGAGTRGITKTGAGTLALNRSFGNSYDGPTVVNGGTLLVNNTTGSGTGTGNVTINSGATLGGTGRIGGATTVNGTLAPGASPGTLTFDANLSLASSSILAFELNGANTVVGSGINDLVVVNGNLLLDGTLNVTETVPGSFLSAVAGDTWRLFNYTGTLTDNTLGLGTMPTLSSGLYFMLDTSVPGQVNLTVIPEPGTLWLVLSGCGLGVVLWRRRRK